MADIYQLALAYRQLVVDREESVLRDVLRAYVSIYQSIEGDIERLAADIARQRDAGVEVTQSSILRHDTLQSILEQVADEISRVARDLGPEVERAQRDLIGLGRDHAEQLMFEELRPFPAGVTVSFNRFHAPAVDQMVGFLADGTPLREALDHLGPEASAAVRDKLVQGIGRGRNPRRVADDVLDALGGSYASAERLSRTTMLNSYRESARMTYQANPDLLHGWRWVAALDDRTCLACVMNHGKVFPLSEPMREHWNGRCTDAPVTKSWEELGFEGIPDTRGEWQAGEDWFLSQSPSVQRDMLGRSKFHAWQAGDIQLSQLVTMRDDRIWGEMYQENSLRKILGRKRAEEWYVKSAANERPTPLNMLAMAADD